MTAVLPSSREDHSRFSPDPLRYLAAQRYFLDSPDDITIKSPTPHMSPTDYPSPITSSAASSPPPSPDLPPATTGDFLRTPFSTILLDGRNDQDNDILLPSYDRGFFQTEEIITPAEPSADSLTDLQPVAPPPPATDDSSVEEEPSRHVDYLSHEWEEEDIWASWRYVVARRGVYEESVRLENASWRTWAKLKGNLGTLSPEALNWFKDCDVTWLYGPLKTHVRERPSNVSPPPSCSETPGMDSDRKSILKKRTASETILQRSLSQHTLLQHAGAILKAQEAGHSRTRPRLSDYQSGLGRVVNRSYGRSSETSSDWTVGSSSSPSAAGSLGERRHIHFNDEVVQCIAVEAKEYDDDDEEDDFPETFQNDSSDDEGVMMKPGLSEGSESGRSTRRGSCNGENRTIAPLPSTTLKYRSDTPEPQPQPLSIMSRWSGYLSAPRASLSSSIETFRPSRWLSSSGALDEVNDITAGFDWHPTEDSEGSRRPWFVDSGDDEERDQNHYLASLGFRPYDEVNPSDAGIFDKVVNTVNTTRDIFHVIWNVGWRG